jgi:hypothetical protein
MKTISYSIIAIFIFGIIAMGFTDKTNTIKINSILIHTADSTASFASLSLSATIIANRLTDFSSEKFDITVIPEKNQIRVTFTDDWNLKLAENLLIQRGTFAFYETYNRKGLSELLKDDKHLFSMFKANNTNDTDAIIGCTSLTEVEKTNNYLNALGLAKKCKFAWSQYSDSTEVCLYALKTTSDKTALIAGTDIESVKFKQDKELNNEIEIKLKKSAIELWADATKRNIGNAIAIVLDNTVISAPVVQTEIDGGRCMITGNFTPAEAKYIAALGNNGELPLNFEVVK